MIKKEAYKYMCGTIVCAILSIPYLATEAEFLSSRMVIFHFGLAAGFFLGMFISFFDKNDR